jgi:hypothetical protein
MNEFQLTLMDYTARQRISLSEVATRVGYDPLLFEKIVMGKDRQIPVDFFIQIANVLNLTTREQDILVAAWAFGVNRGDWPQKDESTHEGRLRRKAG